MGLGIENLTNAYIQNYKYPQSKATSQNSRVDFNSVLLAKGADNAETAQKTNETNTSRVNEYTEYLKARYGNIMIQNVGSDQRSMDSLGSGTYGMNNIVIAPNILETMANDPKKAAYYENMIQDFFASQSTVKAQMAAGGFEIQSYGVVIHPDGTANYYVCGDVSPEKKAKIEVQMKAEGEEKAKRKRRYQELSKEAAEKRKLEMELAYKRQNMTELLVKQAVDTSRVTYTTAPEVMTSVVAAYENNIMGATGILQ